MNPNPDPDLVPDTVVVSIPGVVFDMVAHLNRLNAAVVAGDRARSVEIMHAMYRLDPAMAEMAIAFLEDHYRRVVAGTNRPRT